MEQTEVDQCRLCCGSVLYAEIIDGTVVLECFACGQRWRRDPAGVIVPAPRSPVDHQTDQSQ